MKNRDKIDVLLLVEASVGLLKDINRIRHDDKSNPIQLIIRHIQAMMQPTSNHEPHLKEIRYLMAFELDPGFTKNEKKIIDDVLNKLELDILSRRATNVFSANESTYQIMTEYLQKNSIKTTSLTTLWNEVRNDLINEMNENVHNILEIKRPKPLQRQQQQVDQKARAEIKNQIKSRVKSNPPDIATKPSVTKQGMYQKHKLSPRSEEQPLPPGKRSRK